MDGPMQFPNVHYIWEGGISFVYEVDPKIVVKVPQNDDFAKEQFKKELDIYKTFAQHPLCPSIVQCFLYSDKGIFLEYMRDYPLVVRIHNNHIRDPRTRTVTKVEKLEPLALRKEWMNDLAHAVAFLESLNLAHGDLRPENMLLDHDRIKLSDFDATAEIGSHFEACMAPYGRFLMKHETEYGRPCTAGDLGPRTEQFALGSVFYFINYGFEVYGDRCLDEEDPGEHGPKVVDLLQDMQFPELDGDSVIDGVIERCWHNGYARVADLAAHTQMLVDGDEDGNEGGPGLNRNPDPEFERGIETAEEAEDNGTDVDKGSSENNADDEGKADDENEGTDENNCDGEDLLSKSALCEDLENRGLLELLSSGAPKELGFKVEWYRHISDAQSQK
ncbi:kinase domain-containing protein [Aspergillus carlsbadensis]|nr:kinase domain-containing protein [Aspergillus carlsbadensis]